MTLKALVFDHDGTLVDSEALHLSCWQTVMASYGVSITEAEYIAHHNGIPTLRNAQVFIQTYDLDIQAVELADAKSALFARRSVEVPPTPMPTALETLREAKQQGFRIAIATGAGQADLDRSMQAHKLHQYVHVTATRNDVSKPKPAPDVYLLACERLGVKAADACAFEDTAAGIASAKAAGLYCIAIPNAFSAQQDLSAADVRCASLYDAYKHIL